MIGRRQSGFTLVEILVAIALLGLLGVMAWRGLDVVIDQRARIIEQDTKVERLIRTIAQIERDIDQRIADALLVETAEASVVLPRSMAIAIDEESRHRVTILRRNPVSVGTVTVAYSLDDNQLVRYSTTEAYAAPDRVLLLENIAVFRTQVLSQRGWVDVRELQDSRAMAIEISIERTSGERYRKVMPL